MKRDSKGRFVTSTAKKSAVGIVNHVAFIVDESSSMGHLRRKVVDVINDQIALHAQNADRFNQTTYISVRNFSGFVRSVRLSALAQHIQPLANNNNDYFPSGTTSLLDAIGLTINELRNQAPAINSNESFLVIILTDGEENTSRLYKNSAISMLQNMQNRGNWSFVFMGPHSSRSYLISQGVPAGNIETWDGTMEGLDTMSKGLSVGTQSFYGARNAGARSVGTFFTDINSKQVTKKLDKVNDEFAVWNVNDEMRIDEFVNSKLAHRNRSYEIGRGFYELTKPERIQGRKEIAVMHKKTGAIYSGDAARDVIQIPRGGEVKVKPGNHGDFSVFVQSTSVNRKLVRGTKLLYRK